MLRFRLRSDTVAVSLASHGKWEIVTLPANSQVEVQLEQLPDPSTELTGALIDVNWSGRTISMFLHDLLERADTLD